MLSNQKFLSSQLVNNKNYTNKILDNKSILYKGFCQKYFFFFGLKNICFLVQKSYTWIHGRLNQELPLNLTTLLPTKQPKLPFSAIIPGLQKYVNRLKKYPKRMKLVGWVLTVCWLSASATTRTLSAWPSTRVSQRYKKKLQNTRGCKIRSFPLIFFYKQTISYL